MASAYLKKEVCFYFMDMTLAMILIIVAAVVGLGGGIAIGIVIYTKMHNDAKEKIRSAEEFLECLHYGQDGPEESAPTKRPSAKTKSEIIKKLTHTRKILGWVRFKRKSGSILLDNPHHFS